MKNEKSARKTIIVHNKNLYVWPIAKVIDKILRLFQHHRKHLNLMSSEIQTFQIILFFGTIAIVNVYKAETIMDQSIRNPIVLDKSPIGTLLRSLFACLVAEGGEPLKI